MTTRRRLLAAFGAGAISASLESLAQQRPAKVHRIGYMSAAGQASESARTEAFRQGLRELGYVEGKSILVEYRWAEGDFERLPGIAAELVGLKVDVIVAAGLPAIRAAQLATQVIPIVFPLSGDAARTGIVASLARPGGNATGLTTLGAELGGKRLELLKEVVPRLLRVTVLLNPTTPTTGPALNDIKVAASSLGLEVQPVELKAPEEFESIFSKIGTMRAQALLFLPDEMFNAHRKRLMTLSIKSRMPTMYFAREGTEDGGLISYSSNAPDQFRRATSYVDKILKGAKPGELPVEQPTKFELLVNLRTAKMIGITIPQSILARADTVIE